MSIEVCEPEDHIKQAIVDRDYDVYSHPCYDHFNWCLDYLDSSLPRVTNPNELYPEEFIYEIQKIMIEACSKRLEEQDAQIQRD